MRIRSLASVLALALLPALPLCAQDFSGYSGAELYKRFCASCHGASGEGDGPVAAALLAKPPDLTRLSARRGGTWPESTVRRIIDGRELTPAHGGRDMPVWGLEFGRLDAEGAKGAGRSAALIDRLVVHLRSMQRP